MSYYLMSFCNNYNYIVLYKLTEDNNSFLYSPNLEAAYCCNQEGGIVQTLQPGIYGLSNHLLDSPWLKVTRGKEKFTNLVSKLENGSLSQERCEQQLLSLLCDDTRSVLVLCVQVFYHLKEHFFVAVAFILTWKL